MACVNVSPGFHVEEINKVDWITPTRDHVLRNIGAGQNDNVSSATDEKTGKQAAINMVSQTIQSTTQTKRRNRESRHVKLIKHVNSALSLYVKVLLILSILVAVHIVLYLSTKEVKINYKVSSTSGNLYLRESNSSSEVPGALHVLHKQDPKEVETFRKSKNLSALVRSRKPGVLKILDKHVNTENVEKLRKSLASIKITSKMFFPSTNTKSHRQISVQNSCAVIGSSGILKGSSCGQEIDAHDFVIRENMAPVKGFEADVGSRTSMMTSNDACTRILFSCLKNPSKSCHKKYTEVLKGFGKMYFGIPVYHDRRQGDQRLYDKFISTAEFVNSEIDFRIPLHKFRGELDRYWKLPNLASGGFVNVNIALTFCKRISLYGFFPFSRDLGNRKLKYHYYDSRTMKGGLGVHNMPIEYKIFKELHNNHTLRHVIKRCI